MDAIAIPVGRPASFDELKRLNPDATPEELADAFSHLPTEIREQAWEQFRLRAALADWDTRAALDEGGGPTSPTSPAMADGDS
jgi:hypothetical protein